MGLIKTQDKSRTPPPPSVPLHLKYRPQSFADVIGQDAVVANLVQLFKERRVPHSFLFTGPSGTGKTTLARIIAGSLGCIHGGVIEVDAARYSGIDAMRELLVGAQYQSLGGDGNRCKFIIVDECHALSKATFQTLLKTMEEPAEHLYWALCTTESDKVPETIRTRCHAYDLKPVKWDLLAEYLGGVATEEKLSVPAEFIDIAARRAQGSVRQALVYLSMLVGITTKADALRVVEEADEQADGPIALARMLVSGRGASWAGAQKLIEGMDGTSPESIRITVVRYAAAVLAKEASEKKAVPLLAVIQAFSVPCNSSEGMAPILLAVGSLLLGG